MDTPEPPNVWPPAPTLPPPEPAPPLPKSWIIELFIKSLINYVLIMLVRLIIEPRLATIWQLNLFLAVIVVSLTALGMWIKARRVWIRTRQRRKKTRL